MRSKKNSERLCHSVSGPFGCAARSPEPCRGLGTAASCCPRSCRCCLWRIACCCRGLAWSLKSPTPGGEVPTVLITGGLGGLNNLHLTVSTVPVCRYSLNLVESQLWNEANWRGKYIGVVPRTGKEGEVHVFPATPPDHRTRNFFFYTLCARSCTVWGLRRVCSKCLRGPTPLPATPSSSPGSAASEWRR